MFRKRRRTFQPAANPISPSIQEPDSSSEDELHPTSSTPASRKRPRLSRSTAAASEPVTPSPSPAKSVVGSSSLFVSLHASDDTEATSSDHIGNLLRKEFPKKKPVSIKRQVTGLYKRFPPEIRQMILAEVFPPFKNLADVWSNDVDFWDRLYARRSFLENLTEHTHNISLDHFVKADIAKFLDMHVVKMLKELERVDDDLELWEPWSLLRSLGFIDAVDSEWVDVGLEAFLLKGFLSIFKRRLTKDIKASQAWLNRYMRSRPSER